MSVTAPIADPRERPDARPVALDPRRWHWSVQVLAVYVACRLVTAALFVVVAREQVATGYGPASPDYFSFVSLWWDGEWFRRVAEGGYPVPLPTDAEGAVRQNEWAFLPLYPALARAVMVATGAGWQVVAPLLSTVAGAGAMLLVHRALTVGAPRAMAAWPGLALASVAALNLYPAAPVLQAAYPESLTLALLAGSLILIVRRRYWWALLLVALLASSRNVALPLGLVIVVHAVVRWRTARAGDDAFTTREKVSVGVLLGATAVLGVAWPVIAGAVTGVPDAFTQTQDAWRYGLPHAPFAGWDRNLDAWFGRWAPLALAVIVLGVVALLVVPPARRLGPELYAWVVGYTLFVTAAVPPSSSVVRYALMAFPLAAVVISLVRRPRALALAYLWTLLALLLVAQAVWIYSIWRYTPGDGISTAP